MRRSWSARLAVLLLMIPLAILIRMPAEAVDECVPTPTGIECSYAGTTTSTTVTEVPPLRYLATMPHPTAGPCWYWSRFPPGLDSLDPANDAAVLGTRFALPQCPDDSPGQTIVDTSSRAWEVFRSWTLARPSARIRPTVGITNLPSVLTAPGPSPLSHEEALPDGRVLRVEATVAGVIVDWGDGSPPVSNPAATVFGPGAPHPYRLKTCSAAYRSSHPSGPNCHPTLAAYPVSVTFEWLGRYRTDGSWTTLGTILRSASFAYDVDEIVGITVMP